MKILIIRSTGGLSGAERYNLSLIQALKKAYQDIETVFLTDNQKFKQALEQNNTPAYLLKTYTKEIGTKRETLKALLFSPLFCFKYIRIIKKLENGKKFNAICLQSMTEKIFLTPVLKLLAYKVIWIEHGPLFITNRFFLIKKLFEKISSITNMIVVVSEDTKADLVTNGIDKKKVIVISSSVDTTYFTPLTKKVKEETKQNLQIKQNVVIGYCGSISSEKGIAEFLETAALLCQKSEHLRFLFVGDTQNAVWLKEMIKKAKMDKYFVFTGFQNDVKKYLGIMDIFFFPTNHHEGLSMALLEAASMELLILAHDIGGNREIIIDAKTGFLYKTFNAEQISEFLLNLITHLDTYEDIKENARELAIEKYDTNRMAEKYYNLFIHL